MATVLEFRETLWGSLDGRRTKIKDLTVGHLTAILNWIRSHPTSYPPQVYKNMVQEAHYRKLLLFADGKPYPVWTGDAWELVDPATGETLYEPPPQTYLDAVKASRTQQEYVAVKAISSH
jgi:hypothetical protein